MLSDVHGSAQVEDREVDVDHTKEYIRPAGGFGLPCHVPPLYRFFTTQETIKNSAITNLFESACLLRKFPNKKAC